MYIDLEYGDGLMNCLVQDDADIFVPGETVKDPPCITQTYEALYDATLKSVRNPIGMPPLRELGHEGSKVVFVIPDIVKGGTQELAHRKISIKVCLDEKI